VLLRILRGGDTFGEEGFFFLDDDSPSLDEEEEEEGGGDGGEEEEKGRGRGKGEGGRREWIVAVSEEVEVQAVEGHFIFALLHTRTDLSGKFYKFLALGVAERLYLALEVRTLSLFLFFSASSSSTPLFSSSSGETCVRPLQWRAPLQVF